MKQNRGFLARNTMSPAAPALCFAVAAEIVRGCSGASAASVQIGAAWFFAGAARPSGPVARTRSGFCSRATAVNAWQNRFRFLFVRHQESPISSQCFFFPPPFRPPLRELALLDFFPRPLPLFLPPLSDLFTVAQARRSASFFDVPRFS
jgi:hypothetical protein